MQQNDYPQKHTPPTDRDIDKYAETVCLKLSETKACFKYDQETARGLARFLKVVGNLEAIQRNIHSDTSLETE